MINFTMELQKISILGSHNINLHDKLFFTALKYGNKELELALELLSGGKAGEGYIEAKKVTDDLLDIYEKQKIEPPQWYEKKSGTTGGNVEIQNDEEETIDDILPSRTPSLTA